MDKKRTILAVVLSSVFMAVWFLVFAPMLSNNQTVNNQEPTNTSETSEDVVSSGGVETPVSLSEINEIELADPEEDIPDQDFTFETDKFVIVFSPRGGVMKSVQLKASEELNNQDVNMIISRDTGVYPFQINFKDFDTDDLLFRSSVESGKNQVVFSRQLSLAKGDSQISFLLLKEFTFYNDEYLFDFRVRIENLDREIKYLDSSITNYTLEFGPQIGPEFEKLDARNDFRWMTYYNDGKRKDYSSKVKKAGIKMIDEAATWIGIEGKYFIVLCYPPKDFLEPNTLGFSTRPVGNFNDVSTMLFKHPSSNDTGLLDEKYQFYIGPKKSDILSQYSSKYFDKAVKTSWLAWLSNLMKMLLLGLQSVVKNWGVAIILMTIIIKLLLFPLTQKSFKSNSKMQALTPKLNELKEKYKDDAQKMQLETAELYKKEGINPLGGCLPLLIQMPIFFALYGLLNTHFELRGAVFIPGWISDLSLPETFISLPESFSGIPVIGNQIRLLPFLMVAMTILQQKFSQNPGAATGQMKIMMYAMPIVFFVIMYNMPSGLVVYWSIQNLLSVFQQIYINKTMKKENVSKNVKDKAKQVSRRK